MFDSDIIEIVGPHSLHGKPFHCDKEENYRYDIGEKLVLLFGDAGLMARCIKDYEHNKSDIHHISPNSRYEKSPVHNYELWNMHRSIGIIGNIHDKETNNG